MTVDTEKTYKEPKNVVVSVIHSIFDNAEADKDMTALLYSYNSNGVVCDIQGIIHFIPYSNIKYVMEL